MVCLNRVQCVEYDHPGNERNAIVNGIAIFPVTPEDLQRRLCHRSLGHGYPPYFDTLSSASNCFRSSGISRTGDSKRVMSSASFTTTLCIFPQASSRLG